MERGSLLSRLVLFDLELKRTPDAGTIDDVSIRGLMPILLPTIAPSTLIRSSSNPSNSSRPTPLSHSHSTTLPLPTSCTYLAFPPSSLGAPSVRASNMFSSSCVKVRKFAYKKTKYMFALSNLNSFALISVLPPPLYVSIGILQPTQHYPSPLHLSPRQAYVASIYPGAKQTDSRPRSVSYHDLESYDLPSVLVNPPKSN